MRTRVGVLIIEDGKLLLIKRFSRGLHYYVIPGGGQEAGETIEETAVREAKEETSLDVVLDDEPWFQFEQADDGHGNPQRHIYFTAKSHQGELKFGLAGPEAATQGPDNSYELVWIDINDIVSLPIRPAELSPQLARLT